MSVEQESKLQGLLGFDPRSREQMVSDAWQQRVARTTNMVDQMGLKPGAVSSAGQLGGLLGTYIGQKMNQNVLSPDQKRDLAVKDKANSIYTNMLATQTSPDMTEDDKGELFQKATAQAYYESGQFDKFHQLSVDLGERKRLRRQSEAQAELLENAVSMAPMKRRELQDELNKYESGETLYVPDDSGKYNFDMPLTGTKLPDGRVRITQNDGTFKEYSQYLPESYVKDLQERRARAEALGARWTLNSVFTSQDKQDASKAVASAITASELVGKMADNIASLVKRGEDPNTIIGTPGKILDFANNLKSGVTAVGNYVTSFFSENDQSKSLGATDFSKAGDAEAMAGKSPAIKSAYDGIQVPSNLKNETERAQYKSAVVQLAYSAWRTMEGGSARQASDKDFANALERIGASSGDSRTMLSVILSMMKDAGRGVDVQADVNRGRASQWFTAPSVDSFLYGNQLPKMHDAQKKMQMTIDSLLGTAQAAPEAAPAPSTAYDADKEARYQAYLKAHGG